MYQTIQPPFTLNFPEMSKKELKNYSEWFHQIMPERLQILIAAIKSTEGYENWVLEGFGKMSFNPVGMMVTHAYALTRGSRNAASLRKLYDYWATLARGEKPPADSGIRVK